MPSTTKKSPAQTTTTKKVVKPARKGTVRTSAGKAAPVTVRQTKPAKTTGNDLPGAKVAKKIGQAAKVAKKAAPKKAAPVPTPDAPLASGWVRQSTVRPDGDTAPSLFTTQTQRRLLRALATDGEITTGDVTSANVGDLPTATQRTVARLTELGFLTVAKSGTIKVTKAGHEFVTANPAPRVRAAKAAPAKKAAKKVPAKKAAPARKATGRKVVRKAAK